MSTTNVTVSKIEDFTLYSSPVGTQVTIYGTKTEAQGYLLPNGSEKLKSEWLELWNTGGFEEGSDADHFVLPNITQPENTNQHIYIVGKVLLSNVVSLANANGVTTSFTNNDLTNDKSYVFNHGIGHTYPIVQVYDNNGWLVPSFSIVNSVGSSTIQLGRDIVGTWRVIAYG